MNQKTRKLTEKLEQRKTMRENLINVQEKSLQDFDEETKRLETKLDMILAAEQPQTKATEAWCRVTNALISKYKTMTEENPALALKQLTRIEGALLAGGFLTEEDLKKAL